MHLTVFCVNVSRKTEAELAIFFFSQNVSLDFTLNFLVYLRKVMSKNFFIMNSRSEMCNFIMKYFRLKFGVWKTSLTKQSRRLNR